MNYKLSVVATLILLTSLGCKDNSFKAPGMEKPKFRLKETKEVKFPLDSLTGFYNNIFYLEDKNVRRLYLFNEDIPAAYIYNYNNPKEVKKVKLATEGPNSIGENPYNAGIFASSDTLYILSYMTRQLFMLAENGAVINHFDLWAKDELNDPYIVATADRMPVKIGNYIYFASENPFQHQDQTQIKTVVRFNVNTGKITMCANRPSFYNKGYFGNYYKLKNYLYLNKDNNSVFCAYGASPCIFEYDKNCNLIDSICLPSETEQLILPLQPDPMAPINTKKLDEYEGTTPAFAQVFYDNKRSIFYRIISHGLSRDAFRTNDRSKGPWRYSLIAYDSLGQKINDIEFNENEYAPDMSFINENGMHIAKISSYKEDENNLTFGVFNLTE